MDDNLLLGWARHMLAIPRRMWQSQVAGNARRTGDRLAFMTPEHRAVHHFVVRELPRRGEPMSPDLIATALNLPAARVDTMLADLEKHMTFVFRNVQGAVVWAYPVTVEPTPHRLTFSTGECVYAA